MLSFNVHKLSYTDSKIIFHSYTDLLGAFSPVDFSYKQNIFQSCSGDPVVLTSPSWAGQTAGHD